jgi:hypothetical protein
LKGTHPLLDSADIHLLNPHINNFNKTTKALLDASKKAGLEVNERRLSYIHVSEMSTRNFPGGKGRPGRGVDNLTALCEPIV